MQLRTHVMTVSAIGMLLLGACNNDNQAVAPASSPAASIPVETQPSTVASPVAKAGSGEKHGGQGGQVIESGPYHLEFVPGVEASSTHLDFFLQKGDSHEAIPDAKVTAQVELPDGTQQSLDMAYDASGKHYTATLLASAPGEYKVAILSDIGSEKVNGRFSFTK